MSAAEPARPLVSVVIPTYSGGHFLTALPCFALTPGGERRL